MNEEFLIKLTAQIDDNAKTVADLNKQIKNLQGKLDKLEIKADSSSIEKASKGYGDLNEQLEKINVSMQGFHQISKNTTSDGSITKMTDDAGRYLTINEKLVNGIAKYKVSLRETNNVHKQASATIKQTSSGMTQQAKGWGDLDTQLKKLNISMNDFTQISKSSTLDTASTRYTDNAGKILKIDEKMIAGKKQFRVTLKEVDSAVETNAKQADKWNYSWTRAFQSFATYMSVSTVFYQIVRVIRKMVDEVKELDSALVELQKVTDLEGRSLENFTAQAYESAASVAKTGADMVRAATEFAKAGYGEDQILELGRLALMYTNIADEEVSASEAAEFMVAQMKTFNIEAENSIHIIDAVNEVANNFAVSSADIAENLGKSSAVMANAGNTYEQMIGLLTAGTEITRDAGKVANGKKIKPYMHSNMYVFTNLNPVIPKALIATA